MVEVIIMLQKQVQHLEHIMQKMILVEITIFWYDDLAQGTAFQLLASLWKVLMPIAVLVVDMFLYNPSVLQLL
jgi:hypothetical protein